MKFMTILGIVLLLHPQSAKADLFSDFRDVVFGFVSDPLNFEGAANAAGKSAERVLILVDKLQDKLDEDTRQYIEEFTKILEETRSGMALDTEKLIDRTFTKISYLEDKIFESAAHSTKCIGEVGKVQVNEAAHGILKEVANSNPSITIFGRPAARFKMTVPEMPSPIDSFNETRKVLELRLAALSVDDLASNITDIHGDIQRLADLTRCHYNKESATYFRLLKIETEYLRRDRAWLSSEL